MHTTGGGDDAGIIQCIEGDPLDPGSWQRKKLVPELLLKIRRLFVTCDVFTRYFFVAFSCLFRGPHLLGKQCLGVFRGFFVVFSWLFRGPHFGQILRVLALEKSSEKKYVALIGRRLSSCELVRLREFVFHKRIITFSPSRVPIKCAPAEAVMRRMVYPDKERHDEKLVWQRPAMLAAQLLIAYSSSESVKCRFSKCRFSAEL